MHFKSIQFNRFDFCRLDCMAYLSSFVSSVSNVISSTASVASAYATSAGSNTEISSFLSSYKLIDKVSLSSTSPLAAIYVVYNAIRKDDQSPVTVFIHSDPNHPNPHAPSLGTPAFEAYSSCARNSLRRLRTLRHPAVLAYKSGVSSTTPNGPVYIVTERVQPLGCPPNLSTDHTEVSCKQNELLLSWGLFRIGSAIQFLNSRSFTHGLIQSDCVFVNNSLEWKLGGFELLHCNSSDNENSLEASNGDFFRKSLPFFELSQHLRPPNFKTASPVTTYLDFWQYGCLIYEVMTGNPFSLHSALPPPSEVPSLLHSTFKRLLSSDEKARLKDFNKVLSNKFFATPLIQVNQFLDELAVKDPASRKTFFSDLITQAAIFPTATIRFKLLPQLCSAFEFGSGGPEALSAIMQLSGSLEAGDFASIVIPPLLRAFKSSDRLMRFTLLGHLPQFAPHLSSEQVNIELFPSIISGCSDLAPQLKEATVRGLVSLVERLSPRNINQELFKQLQTLQFDAHPAVRTNALIGLGRVSSHLDSSLRSTKLGPLLIQSLRDPFPPARQACLRAVMAIASSIDPSTLCNNILPAVCPLLLDPEVSVRDACTNAFDGLLRAAKSAAAKLPEKPTDPIQKPGDSSSPQSAKQSIGWSDWAASSLSKTISSVVQARELLPDQAATSKIESNSSSKVDIVPQEIKSSNLSPVDSKVVHHTKDLSLASLQKNNVSSMKKIVVSDTEEDAWGDWGEEFDDSDSFNKIESNNLQELDLSSSTIKKNPEILSLDASSSKASETPAQKREAYRLKLENRRLQKHSNQNSKSETPKLSSPRGMSLNSKKSST